MKRRGMLLAMNAPALIASLDRFAATLPAVVAGITADDARWKPADGAWSILEVVRHLGDEEVEDFRTRLRLTLERGGDWPAIDPEGVAVQRRYNEGDLATAVARFVDERRSSVSWLRALLNPDWSTENRHPQFGAMSAGQLLAAWPAHDALHLRQLAKRFHQLAARDGAPYDTRYAGEWRA
jgi:hypothetical protein